MAFFGKKFNQSVEINLIKNSPYNKGMNICWAAFLNSMSRNFHQEMKIISFPVFCKMVISYYSGKAYVLTKLLITTTISITVKFQNVQKVRVQTDRNWANGNGDCFPYIHML